MTDEVTSLAASRLSWRRVAEVSGLLGAFLYVCGWLFFAAFFAEFDVTPEDAGITFQFVIIRAGIILVTAFAGFLLIASVFRRTVGRLLSTNTWSVPNTAFITMFFFLEVLVMGALILALNAWRPWRDLASPINAIVAIVVLAIPIVVVVTFGGIGLRAIGYNSTTRNIQLPSPVATFLVFAFVGAVVVSLLMVAAPEAAQRVRAGQEFSLFGVRVDRVTVLPASNDILGSLVPPGQTCMTLIGDDGSNFVLYSAESQRTLIVNSQLVALSRDLLKPCSETHG